MLKITQKHDVPTGTIVVAECDNGRKVEFLSIGDYGKEANVKADFLGLESPIEGVTAKETLPLEEKWVVTISTQHGCSMGCKFCDVPKVGRGINVPFDGLVDQVLAAIDLHPEVKSTKRLNLHYARMGEPSFNEAVLNATMELAIMLKKNRGWGFHPVVSTMMPRANKGLEKFVRSWLMIKNGTLEGEAGLQLSINSTDDAQRGYMFSGSAHGLKEISEIMRRVVKSNGGVRGRKIALNVALTPDTILNAELLAELFSPEHYMVKITPMHMTNACEANDMFDEEMYGAYVPYEQFESQTKKAGFDTLVFIPSLDEDLGRITCGNAVLSGTEPLLRS